MFKGEMKNLPEPKANAYYEIDSKSNNPIDPIFIRPMKKKQSDFCELKALDSSNAKT